jgi:hypothetical protein
MKTSTRTAVRWIAAAPPFAALTYGAYVAVTWSRYGRVAPPRGEEHDALLDRFMPTYEVLEHRDRRVAAPACTTLAAARNLELLKLPAVRSIERWWNWCD